jgi:phosphoglycolate phosphatase-like HAD superfamily hydrolase
MSDYWRAWRSELRESGRLSDDSLPSVLYELQQRDLSLGIVTSLPSSPEAAVLRHFGISSYFGGCVVTYATCSRRKPHADPIIHAMGQLRHPAAGTLYVGDSANDVEASKAAGVHFGLVDWSLADDRHDYEKAADVVLKSFADLLDMSG